MIAVILGSAPCWSDDLVDLLDAYRGEYKLAVLNHMVNIPIKYDYFFTGHPELFHSDIRRAKDKGREFVAVGSMQHVDYDETFCPRSEAAWGGSAAQALVYFASRNYHVVLCGCPFDRSGHFHNPDANYHADELWDYFKRGHPSRAGFNDKVRSMSGQTRELFGYPTKEWLDEHGS